VKILVVDDNPDIRFLVRMQAGCVDPGGEVFEATNGVEAIEVAAREQPDVVVLDLDMPMMSGDAALPLLRTVSPASVIAVNSATPLASAPKEGLEHADAYLLKPRDDVGEFLADLVARRREVVEDS
jgi:CheY-like chemotaxis protein